MDICNEFSPNYQGIHTFYSTVIHEVEHAVIHSEVWSYINPNENEEGGYLDSYDDDRDHYKDIWELYVGMPEGFMVGSNDSYDGGYASCYCTQSCSVGSMYEERRCRMVENMANHSAIDQYDWSFDPTNINQGKQW